MSVQDLDLTVSVLHDLSSKVKSKTNQGASVHRLPNEILHRIFKHLVLRREAYAGYELYVYGQREPGSDTRTILRLTHVCRRWRDLLLNSPSLWARISCSDAEVTRTFLERSRSAPLSLVLSDYDPNAEEILAEHGWRLERLDLAISEGSDLFSLLSTISPWPSSLECLTIYAENTGSTDGPRTSSLLFSQPSLGLKALALAPAPCWLPSNHFPALTHLHLDGASEMRLPNVNQLLTLLMNSPALQFIHISAFDLDDKGDTIPRSTPTIALNHLRSLAFVSCDVETFDLLNYLSIPRHVCLRVHGAEVKDSRRLRVPFLPLMEDLEELEIATEDSRLHVVATDGRSRGFWLHVSAVQRASWKSWICDTLPATIPLSRITSLRVYLGDDLAILPTVLSHMPKLSELRVSFPYSHSLKSNHSPRKPSMSADAPGDVVNQSLAYETQGYLNLRHIHLEVVLHWTAVYKSQDDGAAAFTDMCPPTLVRILATRAKAGLPVSLLTMQPVVSAENIRSRESAEALRPVVGRAFVPVEQYVEEFAVYPVFISWDRTTRIFEMKSLWNIDGAEEYWDIDADEMPKYGLLCP
ncbi:hypothetical protein K466DRAFT_664773 [Polyporus arcularius HHB13444]|uniref:F-box domain-containing protein n=1 Tax=Polyporus arcularius HHB13444 TaxID=1314778 RepID=A0A5C3P5S8_9APHY|nr:hypothetical protein K466DRAFT_664773 [Polyporus arcularius HHB13444]